MDNWIELNIRLDCSKQYLHTLNKLINESSVYPKDMLEKRKKTIDEIARLEHEIETIRMRYTGKRHVSKKEDE